VPCSDGLRNPRRTGSAAITCVVLVSGIVRVRADLCRSEGKPLSSRGQTIRLGGTSGRALPRAVRLNPEGASLGAIQSRAQLDCVLMWNGSGELPDIFTGC
jgi:hypothetical protein